MAGDGVKFAYEDEDFQELLKECKDRIKDAHPVMKTFAEYMIMRTDDRFRAEQAPDGTAWEALAPATVRRKQNKGYIDKILQQQGYLKLVHPHADKDSAGVYSKREYAAIHNRGGKAGIDHKVKIPKREFLNFNDEDIREFEEVTKDWIILGRK